MGASHFTKNIFASEVFISVNLQKL